LVGHKGFEANFIDKEFINAYGLTNKIYILEFGYLEKCSRDTGWGYGTMTELSSMQ
jgi:hypothetical protein